MDLRGMIERWSQESNASFFEEEKFLLSAPEEKCPDAIEVYLWVSW